MKKILILAVCSVALFSCNKTKNYTCECTYVHIEGTTPIINVERYNIEFNKEEVATSNCKALGDRYLNFNTKGECLLLK